MDRHQIHDKFASEVLWIFPEFKSGLLLLFIVLYFLINLKDKTRQSEIKR